jgi:integrase
LRWSDIDLDGEELVIRRAIAMVNGAPYEKSTKTHASRRVSLDEATVLVLREHRRRMLERAMALGVRLADDAYVFADVEGRPWRPDVCTNRFGRLRAQLGLDRVRLHDLRHFVATVLGDGGVPIATISSRLGHRDTATTLNIYTHALPATDRVAATYLGAPLSPKSGVVGPIELLLLGAELEAALGVRVDIGTRQTLSEGLRDEVLAESVPL